MNEYQQKEYEKKVALVKVLNSFDSGYRFKFEPDQNELDKSEIALTGIIPIYARYIDYKKKYIFFLRHRLPYVRYETEKQVKKDLKEPQNVGVLHKNKIKAWIDYLVTVYEKLVVISQQRVKAVADFEIQIKALNGTIGQKDYYGTFSGSIVKNGIEFSYTVHDEGYISKKLEIHFSVDDSLDNFIKLSENKL